MAKVTYKKYSKEEQKTLAAWAADCAERMLPLFEQAYPNDDRPRHAIETCREWVRTGVFNMSVIRGASLSAHASARVAAENEVACAAAHAAGQAVATAHVTQHAYGGAYYALKAIAAKDPTNAQARVEEERNWQAEHLPEKLRQEIMERIIVQKQGKKLLVKIDKSEGF